MESISLSKTKWTHVPFPHFGRSIRIKAPNHKGWSTIMHCRGCSIYPLGRTLTSFAKSSSSSSYWRKRKKDRSSLRGWPSLDSCSTPSDCFPLLPWIRRGSCDRYVCTRDGTKWRNSYDLTYKLKRQSRLFCCCNVRSYAHLRLYYTPHVRKHIPIRE